MAFFARAIGRSVARAVLARSVSRMASKGLSNRFGKSSSQRNSMRNNARSILRGTTAGRYGALSELAEEIGELYEEASQIVEAAFYEAMDTMYGMCANAGQDSVFFSYVMPDFASAMESTEIGDDWPDVDIGEYMYFMGEIVEAGNAIMAEAFDEAASLKGEADDAEADFESLEEEGISEDEFF
jgi:hypothetical protein